MIATQLTASLFALALVTLAGSVIGLYARPREVWRGFWFMSGLWGAIDGPVAWVSFVQPPPPTDELHTILGVNLLLQLVYLPIGVALVTRTKPVLKGFGLAILVQALALAAIDATFYYWTRPVG